MVTKRQVTSAFIEFGESITDIEESISETPSLRKGAYVSFSKSTSVCYICIIVDKSNPVISRFIS